MKTLYSATKPTGILTIGNYLGAIKNWITMQDEYNCYFCIANLHAHTIELSAEFVRQKTLEQYAMFLACGLDPKKSTIYVQSMVKEHFVQVDSLSVRYMIFLPNPHTKFLFPWQTRR